MITNKLVSDCLKSFTKRQKMLLFFLMLLTATLGLVYPLLLSSDPRTILGSIEDLKVKMVGRGTDASPLDVARSMLARPGVGIIVVLTDEISASASEIFAGAIQDNDRGLIIGRRTYGKGLVQSPISLSDGSEIRLTIARYYTPSGRCIQKQYTLGEGEEYDQDIYNRFMHGEFDSADSIKLDDHLKYQTAGGRTVYGGGGIMPDIFIPRDTSGISSYFTSVVNSGVLYLYALEYSDHHRKEFAAYKDYEELHAYLKQQPLLEDFTNFAAKKGIRKRPHLIAISGKLIEKQLQAYIVRNFFDDAGFYPIFLSDDVTLLRAVKVLQEGKSNPIFNTDGNLQSQASTPQGYGLFKEIIHEDAVAGLV